MSTALQYFTPDNPPVLVDHELRTLDNPNMTSIYEDKKNYQFRHRLGSSCLTPVPCDNYKIKHLPPKQRSLSDVIQKLERSSNYLEEQRTLLKKREFELFSPIDNEEN